MTVPRSVRFGRRRTITGTDTARAQDYVLGIGWRCKQLKWCFLSHLFTPLIRTQMTVARVSTLSGPFARRLWRPLLSYPYLLPPPREDLYLAPPVQSIHHLSNPPPPTSPLLRESHTTTITLSFTQPGQVSEYGDVQQCQDHGVSCPRQRCPGSFGQHCTGERSDDEHLVRQLEAKEAREEREREIHP